MRPRLFAQTALPRLRYRKSGGNLTFQEWESGQFGGAHVSFAPHPTRGDIEVHVVRHGRKETFSQTNRTLIQQLERGFLTEKAGTNVLSLEELRGKKVLDLAAGNAAAGNDDARALPGKGQRSCFADTGSASSDDHRLVPECFHS
jgi:hypothetical protein